MAEIIDNLTGFFIARVVGYDKDSRELDVFIPKLMPAIPDGQKDVKIMTNLGNPNINVKFNESIVSTSSIRVRAQDARIPLPDINSSVIIYFLDEKFEYGFWFPFNVNNDYKVIETEKYSELSYITINDKKTIIKEFDDIRIELPEGFSVILTEDSETKVKNFKISQDQSLVAKITNLENIVGNDNGIIQYTDNEGNTKHKTLVAKGLYKKINSINSKVEDLETIIGDTGVVYEYTPMDKGLFEENTEYFIFANSEYTKIELNSLPTISEKETFLESLITEGYKLFKGKKVFDSPSGIFSRLQALEKRIKILEEN